MPKIDLNTFHSLKESTGGDFIGELIDAFLDDGPTLMNEMRTGLVSGNADSFRRAAHSMKSNAATFGAMELSALAKELETLGRENNLSIGDRLERLEAEFRLVAKELNTLKQ
ncbi:MAG: histidine kinase [Chloroflexi bacterium HGW-Chloroflexi-6]|nr:MAG: histidine kinase [Chloroflexi bacterium HGW-Chloroflexi-6]